MKLFDLAKKNYDRGLWTVEMLKKLVEKNNVNFTQDDFDEIVNGGN